MASAWIDGVRATAEDLRALALVNYGHFSSMQVRGRAVQGLDLHLERLRSATAELFGASLDEARIRNAVLAALDAEAVDDASVRATVYSRGYDFQNPGRQAPVDLLVSVAPPHAAPLRALRLKSYPFARAMPHLKHVGTFPQLRLRALAAHDGCDEALFVSADGEISEAAVWNIVFRGDHGFVWPAAPALAGTAERLIRAGLQAAGIAWVSRPVRLAEAPAFRAAYLTNSSGIAAIAAIDGHAYAPDTEGRALLEQVLRGRPWQPLAG